MGQKQFVFSLWEGAVGRKAGYSSCHYIARLARRYIAIHTSPYLECSLILCCRCMWLAHHRRASSRAPLWLDPRHTTTPVTLRVILAVDLTKSASLVRGTWTSNLKSMFLVSFWHEPMVA
jgi:hypothetical protein